MCLLLIRGKNMEVSYKKLWIELVKRDMNKTELVKEAGISWTSGN